MFLFCFMTFGLFLCPRRVSSLSRAINNSLVDHRIVTTSSRGNAVSSAELTPCFSSTPPPSLAHPSLCAPPGIFLRLSWHSQLIRPLSQGKVKTRSTDRPNHLASTPPCHARAHSTGNFLPVPVPCDHSAHSGRGGLPGTDRGGGTPEVQLSVVAHGKQTLQVRHGSQDLQSRPTASAQRAHHARHESYPHTQCNPSSRSTTRKRVVWAQHTKRAVTATATS